MFLIRLIIVTYLNLFFRIKVWLLASQLRVHAENVRGIPIDTTSGDVKADAQTELSLWLQVQLRRFPYWARGHLELGAIALRKAQLGLAYSASQAVLQLQRQDSMLSTHGHLLLGKIYLRSGDAERALEEFQKINPNRLNRVERNSFYEDKAGALIALEQYKEASEIFQEMGTENISASGHAALEFLRTKI